MINSIYFIEEPLAGKDANSPSITNQLRNEELERRKAVTSSYDMFAEVDDIIDTNVKIRKFDDAFFFLFYYYTYTSIFH